MSFLDALQGRLIKHRIKGDETETNRAFEKWSNAGK